MFARALFCTKYSRPKFHAHLSAFSPPPESNHALSSGSVAVSSSSCVRALAIASTPGLPLGDVASTPHDPGHLLAALPTHEYLIFTPPDGMKKCQPQYCEQKRLS